MNVLAVFLAGLRPVMAVKPPRRPVESKRFKKYFQPYMLGNILELTNNVLMWPLMYPCKKKHRFKATKVHKRR